MAVAAMMGMMAQQEAQATQQIGLQMMQNEQTHQTKMMETQAQGQRARTNMVEKLGNDYNADSATTGKNSHDSASSASAA